MDYFDICFNTARDSNTRGILMKRSVGQATMISANFALIAVTLNYHAKTQESTLAAGGLL